MTPALKGPPPGNRVANTFEEKEELLQETSFPSAPREAAYPRPPEGSMHTKITTGIVQRALFSQSVQKAPGLDKLNFRALCLLWSWDSP